MKQLDSKVNNQLPRELDMLADVIAEILVKEYLREQGGLIIKGGVYY
ncbi:MAG: hypothetical protein V3V99_01620 [candidate division Zixibacteria bacterium]